MHPTPTRQRATATTWLVRNTIRVHCDRSDNCRTPSTIVRGLASQGKNIEKFFLQKNINIYKKKMNLSWRERYRGFAGLPEGEFKLEAIKGEASLHSVTGAVNKGLES